MVLEILECTKNGIICKFCLYSTEFCTFLSEKKRYIVYNRIVKRYMVFTVWYCCVIWVLARWSYVKWFVKV